MTKHKCFVSYHAVDTTEVQAFIEGFGHIFTPKTVGVSYDNDFIGSEDRDYVMRRLREKYLTDSTVTIVLVGKCTGTRKYVDWEIASTLRNDHNNKRSGLIAINLPSVRGKSLAPPRLEDNLEDGKGYARYYEYPKDGRSLRNWIEAAFGRRADMPNNTRDLFKNNRPCK